MFRRFAPKLRRTIRKRLVTVAMMRPGDKLESYRMLARALALIVRRPWRLTVIGDGPARDEVRAMFADFGQHRVEWLGQKQAAEIEELLGQGGTYVWPGTGEAYGIAYMEAQAAGLPVVAQATAGVPEVVQDGVTGMLTADWRYPCLCGCHCADARMMTNGAVQWAGRRADSFSRNVRWKSLQNDWINCCETVWSVANDR